jgi:ribosomal protein S18 acetylase RimI-like enzyme
MIVLKEASIVDLDFLVWIDIQDEGCSSTYMETWSSEDFKNHRKMIMEFIEDSDKLAYVLVDEETKEDVGGIYARFRNRKEEEFPQGSIFLNIDQSHFPGDGRFCEPFQLWVHPDYRRKGLATKLKLKLEEESIARGVQTLYTHTEETNTHVIELNVKLGYFKVRKGPIWDDIPRVSLIKHL